MNILNESKELYTGIFWYDTDNDKWISVNVPCDLDGKSNTDTFNSKNNTTYNHEKTWKAIQSENKFYRKLPYNYYPRGRVMIRNGVADVYYSEFFLNDLFEKYPEFGLHICKEVRWHVDNSDHYKFYTRRRYNEKVNI